MATPTYTPIASITLGSSASSVTFSSIPQDYRDLVLEHNGTSSNSSTNTIFARLNGDTGSNFFQVAMFGDGSGTGSFTFTGTGVSAGTTSTSLQSNITTVMDYTATDKHKTSLSRHNGNLVRAVATRWANTSAVTSITLVIDTGATFSAGTTFNLYGIAS